MNNTTSPGIADLIVTGGDLLTMDEKRRIILNGAVAIANGQIVAVDTAEAIRLAYSASSELDARDCVVTPGFINTHQHITGDPLARSCVPDDLPPGASIFEWAVPLNDAHYPDDDGLAATLTLVHSLLNGVTTVIEAGTIGHLAPTVAAAQVVGIRAGLGVWGWDIEHGPFTASTAETLARQTATLDMLPTGGLVEGWVCLVGHDLASDALLVGAAELSRSRGARMTMHISPTSNDPIAYLKRTGVRPLVHLQRLGVLGNNLLLAHAVWLDDEEVELVTSTGTSVAYCPWAYLHLGQGVVRMGKHMAMHHAGVAIGLGCDAPNANDGFDILDAARLAVGIAKDAMIDPTCCSAYDGLEMATVGGATAAGLGHRTGSLTVGKAADLVIHDATAPEWSPRGNPVQQLIWSAQGRTVRDVLVAGRQVVRNGRCTTVDEDDLRRRAERHQVGVLSRASLTIPQRWPVIDGRLTSQIPVRAGI